VQLDSKKYINLAIKIAVSVIQVVFSGEQPFLPGVNFLKYFYLFNLIAIYYYECCHCLLYWSALYLELTDCSIRVSQFICDLNPPGAAPGNVMSLTSRPCTLNNIAEINCNFGIENKIRQCLDSPLKIYAVPKFESYCTLIKQA